MAFRKIQMTTDYIRNVLDYNKSLKRDDDPFIQQYKRDSGAYNNKTKIKDPEQEDKMTNILKDFQKYIEDTKHD
jgi:hypothetical protein